MKHMLIVETRDPFETREVQSNADLLVRMRQTGVPCTLMLTENGVLAARSSAKASFLPMLMEAGVEVAAIREESNPPGANRRIVMLSDSCVPILVSVPFGLRKRYATQSKERLHPIALRGRLVRELLKEFALNAA